MGHLELGNKGAGKHGLFLRYNIAQESRKKKMLRLNEKLAERKKKVKKREKKKRTISPGPAGNQNILCTVEAHTEDGQWMWNSCSNCLMKRERGATSQPECLYSVESRSLSTHSNTHSMQTVLKQAAEAHTHTHLMDYGRFKHACVCVCV